MMRLLVSCLQKRLRLIIKNCGKATTLKKHVCNLIALLFIRYSSPAGGCRWNRYGEGRAAAGYKQACAALKIRSPCGVCRAA